MSEDLSSQHAKPLSQQRVDPVAGKRAWFVWLSENKSDVARGVAVVVPLTLLMAVVCAAKLHKVRLSNEALKTPARHSSALVTNKYAGSMNKNLIARPTLCFRMNGTIVTNQVTDAQLEKWARTDVGQTVWTTFHTANGAIFIDDWDPPAAKAPIGTRLQFAPPAQ
jgi:hypothetical protein